MTEKEKMLAGKLYDPSDPELSALRAEAHRLSQLYNLTLEQEADKRQELLDKLLPNRAEGAWLQGPVYFDYGCFTTLGRNFYANFNLTILDSAPVAIGDNVMLGPNCSILTPVHPLRFEERNMRRKPDGSFFNYEYAKPVAIGANCWLAANVTVTGGVTIGEGCVIGAGSVVTRDIPPHSLAAGVPCRVIRQITEADAMPLPDKAE